MKELIIEFGNDTLGETRMYPRNPKGYEQAIKDMKLYKAQQKAEIEYLKAQITAECKEHQETMKVADKTIKTLKKALKQAIEIYHCMACIENIDCDECNMVNELVDKFIKEAEEMMKSD